jgi:hypothetical protein
MRQQKPMQPKNAIAAAADATTKADAAEINAANDAIQSRCSRTQMQQQRMLRSTQKADAAEAQRTAMQASKRCKQQSMREANAIAVAAQTMQTTKADQPKNAIAMQQPMQP